MKKKQSKERAVKKSNQRVKMRSLDEANMKMALKDEANGNGKTY